MSEPNKSLRTIFAEALEIADAQTRNVYLAEACGTNLALRQEVEELIQAESQSGPFLPERPAAVEVGAAFVGAAVALGADGRILPRSPPTEKLGERIGRYKLLEKIGEGGMGVVYMAEQEEPVRRHVALKVIKLGMDTRSVIARFEAERQALALMDHPNIAKVLDAAATEAGRPYFVMELVVGIKITEYCDQNNLSIARRLDLFLQVCNAIQHAHQKGIIHRDIKPSNILVALHDGMAIPKVIDFGIAKATEQRLTDQTAFTAFDQFMGTPAYMSPEQAEMSGIDIDTRSDIYSLGVLLYELLTGKVPFNPKDLAVAGLEEMRRIIREQDPVRPSARIGELDAIEQTHVAKRHRVEAPKLINLVRGDLDWIVMKCLEKDRTRRYEAINGVATDIHRHLNNDPVTAGPPSKLYRFRKFVCKHRAAVRLLTGLVLTCAAFAVVGNELLLSNRAAEVHQITVVARLIEESSAVVLAFPSQSEAEAILSTLRVYPRIIAAALYDANNQLFARYPPDLPVNYFPNTPGKTELQFKNSFLVMFEPVAQGTKQYGTLYLKSDLSGYRHFVIFNGIAVLVIAASFFVFFVVSKGRNKTTYASRAAD